MNSTITLSLALGAFLISAVASYSSSRFLLGFFCPVALLLAYLVFATLQATGGRIEGLGVVGGFTLALILVLGVPVAVVSMFGAFVGLQLARRAAKK